MNAQQNNQPLLSAVADVEDNEGLLSAWLDGELQAHELDGGLLEAPASATRCHTYQLIGDALRGHAATLPAQPPGQFLAAVQLRLAQESLVHSLPVPIAAVTHPVRQTAANDAVFRWKLLAGVASLAAVMAVSWTVLGAVSGRASPPAGPQLSLLAPVPQGVALSARPLALSEPVTVNTSQGVLIRDAQLEALLAEHRQFGGVSALQMPAGFLRSATHDSNAR